MWHCGRCEAICCLLEQISEEKRIGERLLVIAKSFRWPLVRAKVARYRGSGVTAQRVYERAVARGAMVEAVAQLRKGVHLVPSAADNAVCLEQELNLQIALGHSQLATKGVLRAGTWKDIRSCTRALRAAKPISATRFCPTRSVCLLPCTRGAGAGAEPCR